MLLSVAATILAGPLAAPLDGTAAKIVEGARRQLAWGTVYDPSYVKLAYPGGDVPRNRGVCTDVVIRAMRHAGFDLQRLIFEDKRRARTEQGGIRYPAPNTLDPNIDHRRVAGQIVFLKRHGTALTTRTSGAFGRSWRAGDVVAWVLDNGRDHCGIVTDKIGPSGLPTVIHNLSTTLEEDCLTAWKITGHYRFPRSPRR